MVGTPNSIVAWWRCAASSTASGVKRGTMSRRRTCEQRAVDADAEAVHVEQRQREHQAVVARPPPRDARRFHARQRVAVARHPPLGLPVVPDVNINIAGSSVRCVQRGARRCGHGPPKEARRQAHRARVRVVEQRRPSAAPRATRCPVRGAEGGVDWHHDRPGAAPRCGRPRGHRRIAAHEDPIARPPRPIPPAGQCALFEVGRGIQAVRLSFRTGRGAPLGPSWGSVRSAVSRQASPEQGVASRRRGRREGPGARRRQDPDEALALSAMSAWMVSSTCLPTRFDPARDRWTPSCARISTSLPLASGR